MKTNFFGLRTKSVKSTLNDACADMKSQIEVKCLN